MALPIRSSANSSYRTPIDLFGGGDDDLTSLDALLSGGSDSSFGFDPQFGMTSRTSIAPAPSEAPDISELLQSVVMFLLVQLVTDLFGGSNPLSSLFSPDEEKVPPSTTDPSIEDLLKQLTDDEQEPIAPPPPPPAPKPAPPPAPSGLEGLLKDLTGLLGELKSLLKGDSTKPSPECPPAPAPVPPPAPAPAPAPVRTPSPAPTPSAEDTDPLFDDEDPDADPLPDTRPQPVDRPPTVRTVSPVRVEVTWPDGTTTSGPGLQSQD